MSGPGPTGYWTGDEARGLRVSVHQDATSGATTIQLGSAYWYRVTRFVLARSTPHVAWRILRMVAGECKREWQRENGEHAKQSEQTTQAKQSPNEAHTHEKEAVYRMRNLSSDQVKQIYYLVKHSLTREGVSFELHHSLRFHPTGGLPMPPRRKRKRKA